MKRIFLVFLLGILLITSCSNKAIKFGEKDIDLFLNKLEENNFTIKAHYQEINSGRLVSNVEFNYYVKDNTIYREFFTTFKNEPNVGIITKVYSNIEDGKYYDYTYQENKAGTGPQKTYIKEEVKKELWLNSFNYGTSFVADFNQKFTYRDNKGLFTGSDGKTTIKFEENKVLVHTETSARILDAVYSNFSSTKVKRPSFVINYKKDEIIH